MFRPKYPMAPVPTEYSTGHIVTPAAITRPSENPAGPSYATAPTPMPAPAQPTRSVQVTPGSVALLVAGGAAAVLVVGSVLVSLLLAVAVSAASIAVCAVVLRSLLNSQHKRY